MYWTGVGIGHTESAGNARAGAAGSVGHGRWTQWEQIGVASHLSRTSGSCASSLRSRGTRSIATSALPYILAPSDRGARRLNRPVDIFRTAETVEKHQLDSPT